MELTDVSQLQTVYRNYSDEQLIQLALTAAAELTPQASHLFRAELESRNLVPELWPTLEIDVDRMSARQLDVLVARVQSMPCPTCGTTSTCLNGFVCEKLTPLLLVGIHRVPRFHIGCQRCLAKEGAWRLRKIRQGERWKPDRALLKFVHRHAALFTCFADNAEAMTALLRFDYSAFLIAIRPAPP